MLQRTRVQIIDSKT